MSNGWRGKIGRAIPDVVVRSILNSALTKEAPPALTIRQIQDNNRLKTLNIATELGLAYVSDDNSGMLSIGKTDWAVLKEGFHKSGYRVDPILMQSSFAAQTTWSIVDPADTPNSEGAELQGLGAVWQVYPGPINPRADAHDFVAPIDAVYTWVDSSDPSWRDAYREALPENKDILDESATDMGRFSSHDELRYSLRSIELNLPWIDTIYLVTAGQQPSWLVDDHPKLVLVDHKDIFPDVEKCLPTFNSHAIESQLANISGLKEHFLYVNDDVFFGRFMHPNSFYGPAGQAKYQLSARHFSSEDNPELPVNRAAANNREVIAEGFGRTTSRKFKHVAHPQRLTVHRKIQEDCKHAIVRIAQHKFRNSDDLSIPSSLAHHYAARMGMGYPADADYQYLDIGSPDFYLDVLRFARRKNPEMFCINEVLSTNDGGARSDIVRKLLEAKFPVISSFENQL